MWGRDLADLKALDRHGHDIFHHSRAHRSPHSREDCPIYLTLRDGRPHHETRDLFCRKDGSCFPVEYLSNPIRTARGVGGTVVIVRELSDCSPPFPAVTNAPVVVYGTDCTGRCTYVNQRWTELTGFAPDQSYGYGWVLALHPADRDRVVTEWEEAVRSRGHYRSLFRLKRVDGSYIWTLSQASPLGGQPADTISYIGTLTDISLFLPDKDKTAEHSLCPNHQKALRGELRPCADCPIFGSHTRR